MLGYEISFLSHLVILYIPNLDPFSMLKMFFQTVLMDQSRFQEMQLDLDQLILIGAILLVTFNASGTALSDLPAFTNELKMAIQVLLTGLHLP